MYQIPTTICVRARWVEGGKHDSFVIQKKKQRKTDVCIMNKHIRPIIVLNAADRRCQYQFVYLLPGHHLISDSKLSLLFLKRHFFSSEGSVKLANLNFMANIAGSTLTTLHCKTSFYFNWAVNINFWWAFLLNCLFIFFLLGGIITDAAFLGAFSNFADQRRHRCRLFWSKWRKQIKKCR